MGHSRAVFVALALTSAALAREPSRGSVPPPPRATIPVYPTTILDDCTKDQLAFTVVSIAQTIQIGAPLYNGGDHVGCYRLYLGTAMDIVQKLSSCSGVRGALVDGMTRASTTTDYTEQAWAMRDAFDGIMDVYQRRQKELAAPEHRPDD